VFTALSSDLSHGALQILGMNELEHRCAKDFLLRIAEGGFPSWIHLLEIAISGDYTCQIWDEVEEEFKVRLGFDCKQVLAFPSSRHPARVVVGASLAT
jgi:hypothetical protein